MNRPSRLTWWHCGLLGAAVLLLATGAGAIAKIPVMLIRGQTVGWRQAPAFAAALLIIGFVCGVLGWLTRLVAARRGRLGDALTGAVVGGTYCLCCMTLFAREYIVGPAGLVMLGAGASLGALVAVSVGDEHRKETRKSSSDSDTGEPH